MNLKELESRIQDLIEVRLPSVFPGQKLDDLVTQRLAAAMHTNLITEEGRLPLAPNVYTIIVNPSAAQQWQQPQILEALVGILKSAGAEAGFTFASQPEITISTDTSLSSKEVNIMASHRVAAVEETVGMVNDSMEELAAAGLIPENAFLIIEGVKVFPLTFLW